MTDSFIFIVYSTKKNLNEEKTGTKTFLPNRKEQLSDHLVKPDWIKHLWYPKHSYILKQFSNPGVNVI